MIDLADSLAHGAQEGWCVKRNCTTCGCPEMRNLLNENSSFYQQRPTKDDLKELAVSLAALDPEVDTRLSSIDQYWLAEAARWLIYGIWRNAGDAAHESIFPILKDTWAGNIYEGMRAHYDRVRTVQLAHWARQGISTKSK